MYPKRVRCTPKGTNTIIRFCMINEILSSIKINDDDLGYTALTACREYQILDKQAQTHIRAELKKHNLAPVFYNGLFMGVAQKGK